MGKSQKPLYILVLDHMWEWPEIQALEVQGHTIQKGLGSGTWPSEPDVILGSRCWRMDEDHREYLDLAISEARKIRYPKGGKDDSTD